MNGNGLRRPQKYEYFAEGGANVLFKPVGIASRLANGTDEDYADSGLLRLRKAGSQFCSIKEDMEFEDTIKPLFTDQYLILHRVIHFTDDVRFACEQALAEVESQKKRPEKWAGIPIDPDESHCLWLQDLSATAERYSLEFKPKWLAQSPTAPPDSIRCRTCAIKEKRAQSKVGLKTKNFICPLAWRKACLDGADISSYLLSIARSASPRTELTDEKALVAEIVKWHDEIRGQLRHVLGILKEAQVAFDRLGVLDEQSNLPDLCTAMTLRDCSIYITFPVAGHPGTLAVKVGDLDKKSLRKHKHWQSTERSLIDEGWYTKRLAREVSKTNCILGL